MYCHRRSAVLQRLISLPRSHGLISIRAARVFPCQFVSLVLVYDERFVETCLDAVVDAPLDELALTVCHHSINRSKRRVDVGVFQVPSRHS